MIRYNKVNTRLDPLFYKMTPTMRSRAEHNYRKLFNGFHQPFHCHYCDANLSPKLFERHCFKTHAIDPSTTCVWCNNYTWPKGKKNKHFSHLLECSKAILKAVDRPPPPEPVLFNDCNLTLLNIQPAYEQGRLYDMIELPTPEHESIWPLFIEPYGFMFENESLNLAASYMFKYLDTRDTHDWLHVMIKAVAFQSFLDAMDEDGGTTRTLLFSCWCNGGTFPEPRHRQHRHLIVVAPKDHFVKNVWSKVVVSRADRPCNHFLCKGSDKIVSALHLLNTLGYVTHRRSQCNFTLKSPQSTPYKMHHFYIYRNLPVDYKLPLALLWPGGVQDLLNQEKFRKISVPLVADTPLLRVGSQWKQKLKYFYKHERGLVVPVAKPFFPTQEITETFFYVWGDRKLYFTRKPELASLDQDIWMVRQAEGGNCFYNCVEEETWTPRPHYQERLSELKPIMIGNAKLKAEMESLKRKCEALEEDNKTKQIKINDLLEKIVHQNEVEIARLKERVKELEKQLERQ